MIMKLPCERGSAADEERPPRTRPAKPRLE